MTEEEKAEEMRKRNAEYQKRYRQSRRDDPSYWEKRHEYSKKYRKSHSEQVKAQKAAYAKRKREQEKRDPKAKKKEKAKKSKPQCAEISDTACNKTHSVNIQPVWKSPVVTIVLAESNRNDRRAIIETRQGSENCLRLKIVVAAESIEELKEIASLVGFNSFHDTAKTF